MMHNKRVIQADNIMSKLYVIELCGRKLGAWPHLSAPLLVWKIRERIEHENDDVMVLRKIRERIEHENDDITVLQKKGTG